MLSSTLIRKKRKNSQNSYSLSLDVTRCITRQSFYKRSIESALTEFIKSIGKQMSVDRPVETGGLEGGGTLGPLQIFAIADFLPIDNDSEKKKSIVKTYKPNKIPQVLLVTLLLSTICNAYT